MKHLKFKIQILIFLIILIGYIESSKVRSRSRSRHKIKNDKSAFKSTKANNSKDGPLSWDLLADPKALETLLKSENNNLNFLGSTGSSGQNNTAPVRQPTQTIQQVFNTNTSIDENQQSKTFRSVGPFDNTTINKDGRKYSQIFHHTEEGHNFKPGFYGSSRLTR
jgi:hypothetical protein